MKVVVHQFSEINLKKQSTLKEVHIAQKKKTKSKQRARK